MKIGALVPLCAEVENEFKKLKEIGLTACQLCAWDHNLFTNEMAQQILLKMEETGVSVSTFWCGWGGPKVWDFYDGPLSLGLVPEEYRYARMKMLIKGSDFAKLLGVSQIATHVGFIPENPYDPAYIALRSALRYVVEHVRSNGQKFLFETGQETPVTLLRMIEDLGSDGLGVNFDPANLLMYGKANPTDALEILGKYILDIHAKDGEYPINSRELGEEKPLGEGRVDFPRFIKRLKELGYDGPITIEREITGERQKRDIINAIVVLKKLI